MHGDKIPFGLMLKWRGYAAFLKKSLAKNFRLTEFRFAAGSELV
jgi:hypothetical protein